ncbi:deoxyribodipyrimidine photo-lyase [Silicimonas algicola]|uniref:Deoxyribodipyrimidine photo-lyase type I n=1 Tax=Silicimonas algicola TaxID=1826607 RepID=A0A316GCN6_9RHOB|nr:deoxyribodipyrimidine photo-lyase [Silicimonas algicola]AZQ66369.1 deoxyribodipyrimidine photo-lyase [Silicimonas algicola]PWK58701.1 deoxyribodipyrimidine photo-lyase type I [Silicimonas algicola]
MAAPAIWWVRKDLRLGDNAALTDAARLGPVLPVFILDEVFQEYGACPLWRFGLGVAHLARTLEAAGSRLILRRGPAADVLSGLCRETGAAAVRWSRAYDPDQVARDRGVKAALDEQGIDAASLPGHVLFEPWTVETGGGGYYKVYSPFWRSVRDRDVGRQLPRPDFAVPVRWPESETLEDWNLAGPMRRGADVVEPHLTVGEDRAASRLDAFVVHRLDGYKESRDVVAEDGTSGLSENLAWGEISPRACWHAGMQAVDDGRAGAETFLKELAWREFGYHLVWHTPRLVSANWREGWDSFPWNEDERRAEVTAWTQGRTGVAFVDAAMREMFVTGRMHNRARMIVASYLTKHLMAHWRIGQRWFEHCLCDWDPASNALGWQWTAGSGPDAAPYFRIFNPQTQADRFDPKGVYRDRWIAEGRDAPTETALSYFDSIPKRWGMSPGDAYPEPVVALDEGRARALAAYEKRNF